MQPASYLLQLSRPAKRMLFLASDIALIPASLFLSFALRYGLHDLAGSIGDSWILFPLMTIFGAGWIYWFGLQRIKLDSFETRALLQVGFAAAFLTLTAIVCSYFFFLPAPRSVPISFGVLFFVASVSTRVLGLYFLNFLYDRLGEREPVIIYGAGSAGIQLASALRQSKEARPIAFVDDNPNLQGLMVAGLPVRSKSTMPTLLEKYNVKQVLISMPSVPVERQDAIVESLKEFDAEVRVLPSYVDMINGSSLQAELQPVSPEELLGRDKVGLDTVEIAKAYAGRVVLVTGAGGSIGSELCRQLMSCSPAKIVLFEQSEYQLYQIERDMQNRLAESTIGLAAYLGSVTDQKRLAATIEGEGVEIILHAAAYKHVPIVEENEIEGARNNILGTKAVCDAAASAGIERLIFVSTDKAVRPTNIMGATKRMAELVVQDAQTSSNRTIFAMVRFGNVLGSSGSVLPLFQSQIAAGGPVTVTHEDVTRYFMTIPEAARLVLLAGAFSKGGDVFVLDMGQPQKIIDIAKRMIFLSGRTVRDPETGVGDIEIQITGLRTGEKLYEELLIDDASLRPTPHPKILRAEERNMSESDTAKMLKEIKRCIEDDDKAKLRFLVEEHVEGYHHQN